MMNVIMVRGNPVNPDVRAEKEAETLANAGYRVTLLGWNRSGDARTTEERSNYGIRRLNLRAPLGKNVIFFLPFWWARELVWLLTTDWDIVHAADFDTYVPALIAAKLKKKPVVYDIYDFYADQVVLPLPVREIFARLDIFLMQFADAIIIVDPSRLGQIRRDDTSGVEVIYNTPRDDAVFRVRNDSGKDAGHPGLKIFYAGVLTPDRDFETIIQAAREIGGIEVEFAGFGYYADHVRELSARESCVSYLGTIPHNEVIDKTLQADLLFAFYNPAVPNNRYASPNKIFEAMMCAKPILVSEGTAMAGIVRQENCGIVVPYGDLEATKNALLALRNTPGLLKNLGDNGRKAYESRYNWKIMEGRLLDLYKKLVPDDSLHRSKKNYPLSSEKKESP
jgi:glycosyltransferase involved in cell wall biosynthesis